MDERRKALDFGAALLMAAEAWRAERSRLLAARGFGGAGGEILNCLSTGELSQSHLTIRIGLSKQAVQQALDGLEAAGEVRREPDPLDRRAKRVFLTERGQQALAEQQAVGAELEERLSTQMGRKEFKRLRKALRQLS